MVPRTAILYYPVSTWFKAVGDTELGVLRGLVVAGDSWFVAEVLGLCQD